MICRGHILAHIGMGLGLRVLGYRVVRDIYIYVCTHVHIYLYIYICIPDDGESNHPAGSQV